MGGTQRQVREVRQAHMRNCWLSMQHSKNIVSANGDMLLLLLLSRFSCV